MTRGGAHGDFPRTKVITVVGTRPEIIRLSEIIRLLDSSTDHVLVHTGQNYDFSLNEVFFRDLKVRQPDYYLESDTSSLGTFLGSVLAKIESILLIEQPDAFLVLGDTNSSIAALLAKRMKIPTYHMEAGNRCFDSNVPEEINRRLVDHVVDFNLVYSEHARSNLIAEGIEPRRILLTGSPMAEVLAAQREGIESSSALADLGLHRDRYVLASLHREENVDSRQRLDAVLECLACVHDEFALPILVSTHPRTRQRLGDLGRSLEGVTFHEPLGFHDYVHLQQHAYCVLSDSGTIAEESTILGFPAVTMRDAIERPEALDAGTIVMSGLDPANVIEGIRFARNASRQRDHPYEYFINDCSQRTVSFMLSTHRRHEQWSGLRT